MLLPDSCAIMKINPKLLRRRQASGRYAEIAAFLSIPAWIFVFFCFLYAYQGMALSMERLLTILISATVTGLLYGLVLGLLLWWRKM